MIEVIPAILPTSFETLCEQAKRVSNSPRLVQVDFVDGVYAPQATWPFNGDPGSWFEKLRRGEINLPYSDTLQFEADLMVQNPEKDIGMWLCIGFSQFIVHWESTKDMQGIITEIRSAGRRVGIALKPQTSIRELVPWVDAIDFVQFMGSETIGYHGVALDPVVFQKIHDLRTQFPRLSIGVDIGVNFETAPRLVEAGATRLAVGSAIFNSDDVDHAIHVLAGEAV